MYAIIADSGRQMKVEEGQEVDLDYREAAVGDQLTLDRVLAVRSDDGLQLGKPAVEGASVTAEVLGVTQGEKISVRKIRRRKNSRRHTGHRSMFTRVRIAKIQA
jgi:large subunit ribosomal protein L21